MELMNLSPALCKPSFTIFDLDPRFKKLSLSEVLASYELKDKEMPQNLKECISVLRVVNQVYKAFKE
jgi:hypothetical protein